MCHSSTCKRLCVKIKLIMYLKLSLKLVEDKISIINEEDNIHNAMRPNVHPLRYRRTATVV